MTSSNRTLNRIILFVLGLAFLIVGLAATASAAGLGALLFPGVGGKPVRYVTGSNVALDPLAVQFTAWGTAIGALIVLLVCLAWILTRGRGGTAQAIRATASDGTVDIDRRYLEDALTSSLEGQNDVTGVSVGAFRFRGQRVCRLIVTVRRGGNVPEVADRVRAAVSALDDELGVQVPILVRLTATSFAVARRAA